jgi:hypothetical protein
MASALWEVLQLDSAWTADIVDTNVKSHVISTCSLVEKGRLKRSSYTFVQEMFRMSVS